MLFRPTALALAALPVLLAAPAFAADTVQRPALTLEGARHVLAAAEAEAAAKGFHDSIVVTDAAGIVLAAARMDGAIAASAEVAAGKARTAALFRQPSANLEDAVNGPRAAAATAGNFVLMAGGLPLMVDGQLVGAIGISGGSPQQDVQVAEAGRAALK